MMGKKVEGHFPMNPRYLTLLHSIYNSQLCNNYISHIKKSNENPILVYRTPKMPYFIDFITFGSVSISDTIEHLNEMPLKHN